MSDSSDTPKWVWQNETLAPEAGLAIIVLVYYVVAALLIAISRMCKPLKSSSLTMLTARQRIFIVLQHKNVLQYIDVVQTGMSLWLCLAYIIESYGVVVEWFDTVEKTFNCLFVVDYVLQMFLSQDRLAYLFGFLAFVDVLTIMPLMVTWFIFRSESDTSVVLRIVRLSKLFRILRSFRLIRASSQDIYRELFLLGLTMVCLIFTAAGFYQLIENNWRLARGEPAILPFDQAMYLATIEILGRPRLQLTNASGHIFWIFMVVVSIVLIPKQLASIFQILQKDPFARQTKYVKHHANHIVIIGHTEFSVLNTLLYEAYHPDRGPLRPCDIVILAPSEPCAQTKDLLSHPSYHGFVQYIQGSPHYDIDLRRVRVEDAMALMVMANKYPTDPAWEDTQVASMILACKAYKNAMLHKTSGFAGRRKLRVLAQVLSSDTRDRIVQMPGWDRIQDVCLVIGELTAAMIAMSSLHRGVATMVLNLVSHTTQNGSDDSKTEEWFRLYQEGSLQEIYHCSIPSRSELCGMEMVEAAHHLLQQFRMLLLAVKREEESKSDSNSHSKQPRYRLVLFPGSETILNEGDRVFVIARSLGTVVQAVKGMKSTKDKLSRAAVTCVPVKVVNGTRLVNKMTWGGQMTWEEDDSPDKWLKGAGKRLQKILRTSQRRLFRRDLEVAEEPEAVGYFEEQDLGRTPSFSSTTSRIRKDGAATVDPSDWPMTLPKSGAELANELRNTALSEPNGAEAERRQRLAELLNDYGTDVAKLQADLRTLGVSCKRLELQRAPGRRDLCRQETMDADELEDIVKGLSEHIIICGGEQPQISLTVRMLLQRCPDLEVVVLGMKGKRTQADWDGIGLTNVYFVNELESRKHDLQASHVERAKSVIILPSSTTSEGSSGEAKASFKSMAHTAHIQGPELRRIVDADTILTTNIVARRNWNGEEVNDIWTVTQLLQETSLGRFFGMAPEAQGATSKFDDRWMNSQPLNMSPLFAAGHIIATATVDRFLIESFFNPDAMLIVERLFGLAGLMIGSKDKDCRSVSSSSLAPKEFPCAFQLPVSDKRVVDCSTYGEAANALLSSSEPVLPLGIFRYPKGRPSSYSLLVSLEAANELDFRSPAFRAGSTKNLGDQPSSKRLGAERKSRQTHRLPYVITNPPQDLKLFKSDLLFVLGREFGPSPSGSGQNSPASSPANSVDHSRGSPSGQEEAATKNMHERL